MYFCLGDMAANFSWRKFAPSQMCPVGGRRVKVPHIATNLLLFLTVTDIYVHMTYTYRHTHIYTDQSQMRSEMNRSYFLNQVQARAESCNKTLCATLFKGVATRD